MLELSVFNDLRGISSAAARIDAFCAAHGVASGIRFDVTRAVDELVTNMIGYGYDDGGEHSIDLVLRITTERQDGALSVHVSGRIDAGSAREFEETVRSAIENEDRAVNMNFENLLFISSTGLRAVLMTAKTLRKRDAVRPPFPRSPG